MFEHFKPLKISLSYKPYKKKHKKIMSIRTKNENMFEHFNLTNISPNKKKRYNKKHQGCGMTPHQIENYVMYNYRQTTYGKDSFFLLST